MLVAFIIAVLVGVVVKIGLSQFDSTAKYADAAAIIVAILVFLAKSGIAIV